MDQPFPSDGLASKCLPRQTPMSSPPPRASLLGLPPEIRNCIYKLVLKPYLTTAFWAELPRKQPALSLTCHQLQQEVLSFWIGYSACIFWPNRHGVQFCFSSHTSRWMLRAGNVADQIRQLQINARMPDMSRFCWEIKLDRDIRGAGTISRVSLTKEAKFRQESVAQGTKQERKSIRMRETLCHPAVTPRSYAKEMVVVKDIGKALSQILQADGSGCIGLFELDVIVRILKRHNLDVPPTLSMDNPGWTQTQAALASDKELSFATVVDLPSKIEDSPLDDRKHPMDSLKRYSYVKVPRMLRKTKVKAMALHGKAGRSAINTTTPRPSPFQMPTLSAAEFLDHMRSLSLPASWSAPTLSIWR